MYIRHLRQLTSALVLLSETVEANVKQRPRNNVIFFNMVAHRLGFRDMCSLEQVAEAYPLLDVVDHDKRKKLVIATGMLTPSRLVNSAASGWPKLKGRGRLGLHVHVVTYSKLDPGTVVVRRRRRR